MPTLFEQLSIEISLFVIQHNDPQSIPQYIRASHSHMMSLHERTESPG